MMWLLGAPGDLNYPADGTRGHGKASLISGMAGIGIVMLLVLGAGFVHTISQLDRRLICVPFERSRSSETSGFTRHRVETAEYLWRPWWTLESFCDECGWVQPWADVGTISFGPSVGSDRILLDEYYSGYVAGFGSL